MMDHFLEINLKTVFEYFCERDLQTLKFKKILISIFWLDKREKKPARPRKINGKIN